MKNGRNRVERFEFDISTKTKTFEKKPSNGGTPAKESKVKDITLVKTFDGPKFANENSVFRSVLIICIIVEKRRNEVIL